MLEKHEMNGKVAVIISPGFGAGWYSWNTEYPQMIFDPAIVKMLEDNPDDCTSKIEGYCEQAYPEAYLGAVVDLTIVWVDKGTEFRINEYDGSETIEFKEKCSWLTA